MRNDGLELSLDASFVVTFSHRYSFEADTIYWDGGVIELSTDGGAPAATGTVNPTEIGGGYYYLPLTQAETDCDRLCVIPASATSASPPARALARRRTGRVPAAWRIYSSPAGDEKPPVDRPQKRGLGAGGGGENGKEGKQHRQNERNSARCTGARRRASD